MSNNKHNHNLDAQKQILMLREEMLCTLGPAESERLRPVMDANWKVKLKSVSPGRLQPVLVQRNHEDWFGAYLLEQIGSGGYRLLVVGDHWRIARIKSSATVVKVVTGAEKKLHAEIVQIQGQLRTRIAKLLEKRCPTATTSIRGWGAPKLKKATRKNSSRCAN